MALSKEKKKAIVKELDRALSNSPLAVFVKFCGLSVSDFTSMRKDLREKDVKFKVAKKTLLKKSLAGCGLKGEQPNIDSEVAFVYTDGKDILAPAREIYPFNVKYKGAIQILGGYFEGRYIDSISMTEIATIPSRGALIGQIANLLNSPISGLVRAINQIADL